MWSTTETTNDIVVSPLITTNFVAYALDTVTGCIGNDTVRVFVGMNEGFLQMVTDIMILGRLVI